MARDTPFYPPAPFGLFSIQIFVPILYSDFLVSMVSCRCAGVFSAPLHIGTEGSPDAPHLDNRI